MLHHWLGWISFAICILLLAKYAGRISGNQKINQLLRRLHRPLGTSVIGIAILHGTISFMKNPQAMIQNITGLMVLTLILLLTATFYVRASFKAKWFPMHRRFAIIFCFIIPIHIVVSFS